MSKAHAAFYAQMLRNDLRFIKANYPNEYQAILEKIERGSPVNTSRPDRLHLYVDATVGVETLSGREKTTKTVSFGPFSDRAEAERALTAFIARENAMGAMIRDPDGA